MATTVPDGPNREVMVFNEALLLPGGLRERYLQQACSGDPDLYCRVEELLHAYEGAGSFLHQAAPPDFLSGLGVAEPGSILPAGRAEKSGDYVGRYKLLQPIGEGGCGVVFLAEQEEPVRRQVALKVIKLGMDTRRVIARFEAERQVLALMDHPNIAKVFDAGATETGRPFFVMELVRGTKVTAYCDQNALSIWQRLELFVQICRAVQHAHQKSVIHRDIKPSNILVTLNDGLPLPKVIDFGIAKATGARSAGETIFTTYDQLIGTPAYMSPEQAVGTTPDVDTRSDIYSLGVLLYELITGQTPFDQKELLAAGLDSMRQILREREPVRPSVRFLSLTVPDLRTAARQRQVPVHKSIQLVRGDLDWITMKCLEKDPARRYQTASDLAADVEHFLAYEPIAARPPTNFYRLQKLIRRHQVAMGAIGSVIAALLLGFGFSTWQFLEKSKAEREQSRLREQAQKAQADEARSRRQAEHQEWAAHKLAYAADMNLLRQALLDEDLGHAQELLNRHRPQPGEPDLRGWEWRYFWQFCQGDAALTLCRRSNSILSVSFSSDGALLAVGTYQQHDVTVWDIASRQIVFQHDQRGSDSPRLAFAPNDSILAFSAVSNTERHVVLWDSRSRSEIRRLLLSAPLRDLAFSRDGRLMTADAGRSNALTIWDTATGAALAHFDERFPGHAMGKVLDVTGDGTRIVHALQGPSHSVTVLENDGRRATPFRVAKELVTAVAFSPDNRALITGGGYADGTIDVWDVETHKHLGALEGHRSWVSCLKFLPDGKTLASASADRTVRLWNVETRHLIRTLRGHRGEVWTLDVSPDGRWLAAGGKDGSVLLWDLTSSPARPPKHRTLPLSGAGWWCPSPDNRWLAVVYRKRVRLYDAKTLELLRELPPPLTNVWMVTFSPDTRWLLAAGAQGSVAAWDLRHDALRTNLVVETTAPNATALFASDGKLLIGVGDQFQEWDTATWREQRRWPVKPAFNSWVAPPGANLMALSWERGVLECISLSGPVRRQNFAGQTRLKAVDLSSDGRTLAAASENGTLEVWDTKTGVRRALLRGVLLGYHSVAISPDGERLIGGSNGQEAIKIWDLHSDVEVATLSGEGSFFVNAAFTPDGNTIGAANWNGELHLWTAPSWAQIENMEANGEPAP